MDIAAAVAKLANGILPEDWPTIAARRRGEIPLEQLAKLTEGLDTFIGLLFYQLQSLRNRLSDAGFVFAFPAHALRTAGDSDRAALDAFIEKHGPLPLSVEAWYRRIASFNFAQDGSQMFDRSHGFYLMNRFHQFTMPPIATACAGGWNEMMDWESDNEEHLTDDGKVFFSTEECGMDEDWKGFAIPDESIDPVINEQPPLTFIQWADHQVRWGGFGFLPRAMADGYEGINTDTIKAVFQL